ncbi:MAG: MFS transporter [Pseudomonadota bacterium]
MANELPAAAGATVRRRVLVTVASLSFANTVPRTLAGILLPAIYRQEGLPLAMFSVFAIPLVVSPLRLLWAPWVDRYGSQSFGRRKSWILPCTLGAAAVFLVAGFVTPTLENLWWIIALLVCAYLFLATQEIAVDAYIVEGLLAAERGPGATARILGEEAGQMLTIAGLMTVYFLAGWQMAVSLAAGILVALTLPALLRPEEPVSRVESRQRPSLADFAARRENFWIIGVIGAAAIAPGLASAVISPFLVDLGLDIRQIGLVLGLTSSAGPIVAGLTLTPWLRRGRTLAEAARIQLFLAPFSGLAFLALALLAEPGPLAVGITVFAASFISTPGLIFLYTARLNWTSKGQAGTDFTVQEAAYVVFRGILPGSIGGPIAALLGWPGFFAFMGLVGVCGFASFVASLPGIDRRVAARSS